VQCDRLATKGGEVIRLINGICAVLLVVMVIAVGIWWIAEASVDQEEIVVPDTHQVQPGETLWQIAKEYYPKRDPREVVWEIRKINQMKSATIYPYEVLKLPK
jgi:nucleoid-associated protein YgaU